LDSDSSFLNTPEGLQLKMVAAAAQRPTSAQVLLGLFISWQLLFLPAANYLAFLPHGQADEGELSDSRSAPRQADASGAVQNAIDFAAGITDAWSHLTGQAQAWWLFAPEVPRSATFPIVELRWDDDSESVACKASLAAPLAATNGVASAVLCFDFRQVPALQPVRLHTVLEPKDPRHYFRPQSSFDRLFHYEIRLGLIVSNWNEQTLGETPEFWRKAFKERVRRQWRSIRAYFRWYVQHFQQENPELPPPKQVILSIRIYQIPGPGKASEVWPPPWEQPLARWRPDAPAESGNLPIEAFDPVARRFVTLNVKD
jgi:hypothetical protein